MKKEKIKYDLTHYTKDFRIKLRHDEYFILGDNRPMSYDSRYFGPVHIEDIRAKNGYIIYPIQHIKRINHHLHRVGFLNQKSTILSSFRRKYVSVFK